MCDRDSVSARTEKAIRERQHSLSIHQQKTRFTYIPALIISTFAICLLIASLSTTANPATSTTESLMSHETSHQNRNSIQRYICQYTPIKPPLDGRLTGPWTSIRETQPFIDITGAGGPTPQYQTTAKLMWDTQYLYIAASITDPNVWTTLSNHDTPLYIQNDFEVFLNPTGNGLDYFEFEINPLETTFQVKLDKPYADGGVATVQDMVGLISAVFVDGTVNNSSDVDVGWSVEIAMPWTSLAEYNAGNSSHPSNGDVWRINFDRIEWPVTIDPNGKYRISGNQSQNWVWSSQGAVNMHIPSLWGEVVFQRDELPDNFTGTTSASFFTNTYVGTVDTVVPLGPSATVKTAPSNGYVPQPYFLAFFVYFLIIYL